MKTQIPRAAPGQICPMHKTDMAEVCHTCPWWMQLKGKNPQTEEELDHWACAIGMLPILLIEGAQQQRQTGAAVESFRNEMTTAHQVMQAAVMTAMTMPPQPAARVQSKPGLLGKVFRLGRVE